MSDANGCDNITNKEQGLTKHDQKTRTLANTHEMSTVNQVNGTSTYNYNINLNQQPIVLERSSSTNGWNTVSHKNKARQSSLKSDNDSKQNKKK